MSDGFADVNPLHSRNCEDIAWTANRFVDTPQSFERIHLCNARLLNRTIKLCDRHIISRTQRSVEDAADGQAPEIIAVIEIRHQQLQDAIGLAGRFRNSVEDCLEKRS